MTDVDGASPLGLVHGVRVSTPGHGCATGCEGSLGRPSKSLPASGDTLLGVPDKVLLSTIMSQGVLNMLRINKFTVKKQG